MKPSVFFEPAAGWVGDVIPLQLDGTFQLFYLHEERLEPKPGMPWNLVSTADFVHFVDHGAVLPSGGPGAHDFNAYTGSVVTDDAGVRHLFYTGQNPARLGADGQPLQVVMHATSHNGLTTWTKHPEHEVGAPDGYETADWRDPFVFKHPVDGRWRMLMAARHDRGPHRRRGVIAQLVSDDLESWSPVEPFWDPRRYITHECPEVFQWGGWWYLVYSEFSEAFTTRYRMSRSPDGPWRVPARDSIDGRAFYAAKSAERDGRRFFFGWIATKEGGRDDGAWQWAGTMSILEATQQPDGTLAFQLPDELRGVFTEPADVSLACELPALVGSPDGYDVVVSDGDLPDQCLVTLRLDIAEDTAECGLLVRAAADGDESYVLRLEPRRGRLVFDRWPRRRIGDAQWEVSGDTPFEIELERPCRLDPGEHLLEVLLDGDRCVAILDREVALSTRLYDRPAGRLGVFAGEGEAVILGLDVRVRPGPWLG